MALPTPSRRIAATGALAAAAVVAAAVALTARGHDDSARVAARVVAAQRGDVAVTVGGVGHVATLTGAARLAVPGGATGGSSAGGSQTTGGAAGGAAASGGAVSAPADAVFPALTGHVTRLLVRPGQRVVAGEPMAVLADDGTAATNALQARGDLATARLELAQKRVQDPARGVPPTGRELRAGREGILAARARLQRLIGRPLAADVAAARSDLAKARADLHTAHTGAPDAQAAAALAVAAAQRRLELVSGAPDPADVAAAQLEVAKAMVDQEALLAAPPAPAPSAVAAADAAIAAAEQKLADARAAGVAADIAAAQAELARARSERDALQPVAAAPTDAARSAAQLAVVAARSRLDEVLRPPTATVTAAQQELAKARADLATARAAGDPTTLGALRSAEAAARRKLQRLRSPPTHDLVAGARQDVAKARADLAVLRQRGAPAGATDLRLARLKADVAAQRLALADDFRRRLTVRAAAAGTVTSVLTTPGAAVDPATPLARVEDLGHLVVTLDLSEFDVARTRVGSPALVSADALGGTEFGGRVLDVALSGNDAGGVVNFPVIIALRSHSRLRPGMSVSARIVVRRSLGVVRVPLAAIDDSGERPAVQVRRPDGSTVARIVHTGLRGATYVEIHSGLRAGERVVVPPSGA